MNRFVNLVFLFFLIFHETFGALLNDNQAAGYQYNRPNNLNNINNNNLPLDEFGRRVLPGTNVGRFNNLNSNYNYNRPLNNNFGGYNGGYNYNGNRPGFNGYQGYQRDNFGAYQGYEDNRPRPYSFQYEVRDPPSGNDYAQQEISDGNAVRGEYRVLLPDSRTQIVRYMADDVNGYVADVQYEGQAQYARNPFGIDGNRGFIDGFNQNRAFGANGFNGLNQNRGFLGGVDGYYGGVNQNRPFIGGPDGLNTGVNQYLPPALPAASNAK